MISKSYQLRRRLAAVPEMHEILRHCYEAISLGEAAAFCLDLAAEEVFTNMVRHNPSARDSLTMEISISQDSARLCWVDHEVPPFDPDAQPLVDVTLPIADRRPGGLGLHLTRSVVDSLTYAYQDGDMRVEVVKKLGA
jgi:serine/threonine-protein kinase RsbW